MSSSAIASAQADFAVKLLREVSNSGRESSILSPVSVAIALSMVYAGAKDKTAGEMAQVLANGAGTDEVHEYFGDLLAQIAGGKGQQGEKAKYTLEVANRLFVKSGFALLDAFKAVIDGHYQGQFESVDFGQSVQTAKKINDCKAPEVPHRRHHIHF